MYKTELVKKAAKKAGLDEKTMNTAIGAAVEAIIETLQGGDNVQLTGFGTFKVREVGPRKAKNLRTGETIDVPAHKSISFKASKKVTV